MNHQQAQSFERLHAAATVCPGESHVSVAGSDVRNLLDALAAYDRLLTEATRELAAAKTQLLDRPAHTPRQDPPLKPVPSSAPPEAFVTSVTVTAPAPAKPTDIPTPSDAGS